MVPKDSPLVFIAVMFCLFLSPALSDSTLGGTMDISSIQVSPGGVGKFEIYLFSLDDSELDLSVSAGSVSDLQVEVAPKTLQISGGETYSPDPAYRWVILGDKYVRIYPVYVYVRVPQKITKNHYVIPVTVSGSTSLETSSEGGVVQKVVQVLQYNLAVTVPGETYPTDEPTIEEEFGFGEIDIPAYTLPSLSSIGSAVSQILSGGSPSSSYEENEDGDEGQPSSSEDTANPKSVPSGYIVMEEQDNDSLVTFGLAALILVLLATIFFLLKK
ncbi:MAG: hypothetical protein JW727_00140 [Candidatus Aenigmarchaeota archaeon]|nr:hypothetical protein [Candidatus Aenigmarchaeota archaeon]